MAATPPGASLSTEVGKILDRRAFVDAAPVAGERPNRAFQQQQIAGLPRGAGRTHINRPSLGANELVKIADPQLLLRRCVFELVEIAPGQFLIEQ